MLQFRSTASHAAATFLVLAAAGQASAADVRSRLEEGWRADIVKTPVPEAGCFTAQYPSRTWHHVACIKAPQRPFIPRHAIPGAAGSRQVGNGNDYAALGNGVVTSAVGSFPTVTGLRSESDGGANIYSLQLNSDFIFSNACNGNSNCSGWEQFVYSSSSQASFIQYWLLNYGNSCPTTPYNDWMNYQGSCYRNSNAVGIPQEPITLLSKIKISGTANSRNDTFVTTVGTTAYSTGGNDNVVFLAQNWGASEFNVVGDGGGSQANFNRGTNITVRLAQHDGTSQAPTCESNGGTTGETNNLNLGSCSAGGGSSPYITFKEHN